MIQRIPTVSSTLCTLVALLALTAATGSAAAETAPQAEIPTFLDAFLLGLANVDDGCAESADDRLAASGTCAEETGCGFYPPLSGRNNTYCSGKCANVCGDPEISGYYQASTTCCICTHYPPLEN